MSSEVLCLCGKSGQLRRERRYRGQGTYRIAQILDFLFKKLLDQILRALEDPPGFNGEVRF